MILPSLNALRAFVAVARSSSMSAAASELGVTHAAVSRHVRALEAWIGVALVRRTGRGVVPTQEGQRLADTAEAAFASIAAEVAALRGDRPRQRLSLSVVPTFASRWLVPRLGQFRALHPGIEVELDPTPALADFRNDRVDLAIRYGRGPWPGLACDRLFRTVDFPVAAPEVAGELKSPADLAKIQLLHEDDGRFWRSWLARAGVEGVDPQRGQRLGEQDLVLAAAAAGQGVALADSLIAAEELASGRLVRLFDIKVPSDSYWLVMPEARRLSKAAGAFRSWILEVTADAAGEERTLNPRE